jgi:hypothetical protein
MVGVSGGQGSHELVSKCLTEIGSVGLTKAEAVSEDGHIVYFTASGHANGECPVGETAPPATWLYARVDGESENAHTVLVSGPASRGCESAECVANSSDADAQTAYFAGASRDGSRVFFMDTQQLTDTASQSEGNAFVGCGSISGPGGCNLYESVCAAPCGSPGEAPDPLARELVDVSAPVGSEPGGPRVQGVVAVSDDGSHVYFVAQGKLTGEEENGQGERAVSGKDNLYVYAEGRLTFITILAASDEQQDQWQYHEGLVANVTPGGGFLVFTDDRALTGDDTRREGEAAAQVFEYDAATRVLKRVSVGEEGYNDNGNAETGNAYVVPALFGGAFEDGMVPVRRDPSVSANGELVFFESPVALVPGALGDVRIGEGKYAENIYEYYRGQVSLISDGRDTAPLGQVSEAQSGGPTALLGVSASGANVVFSTFDQLTSGDGDDQRDYYDAHVCTVSEPCVERSSVPGPCGEGSCQAAGSPAAAAVVPGSVSFVGPGDKTTVVVPVVAPLTPAQRLKKAVKACRAKRVRRRRVACERTARREYRLAVKARRARVRGRSGLYVGAGSGKRG